VLCAGGRKSPVSPWLLKNRMSELFTSGSVGGAASNRRSYPAAELAFGFMFSIVCSFGCGVSIMKVVLHSRPIR